MRKHRLRPLIYFCLFALLVGSRSSCVWAFPSLTKGVWIWKLWELEQGKDGPYGSLQAILDKLCDAGVDWVAIKCGDGLDYWLEKGPLGVWLDNLRDQLNLGDQVSREEVFSIVINKFHERNIKVVLWQFVYGAYPESEAEVAKKILAIEGADGFIVDAEEAYERLNNPAEAAKKYMGIIREAYPDAFIAYTAHPYIVWHRTFPYVEFGEQCDAFIPMVYWEEGVSTIWFERVERDWGFWHNKWLDNGHYSSIKPIIVAGQAYKTTDDQITNFCKRAFDHGYYIILWDYASLENENHWGVFKNANPKPDQRGLQWLRYHQVEASGSWCENVGITSLAALSLLNAGCEEGDAAVIKAVKYVLDHRNADNSFGAPDHATYETSTALWMLVAACKVLEAAHEKLSKDPRYAGIYNNYYSNKLELFRSIVQSAVKWLEGVQLDETENIDEGDPQYGGFGYAFGVRPDLSNTQFALMALDAAYSELGLTKPPPDDATGWPCKATKFVSRCQNRPASNDQDWAHDSSRPSYNDGGFIYYPQWGGCSLAGGTKSYGSMTAAGVWSLRLCGLPVGDERVKAGLNWLMQNENGDFDDNPGHPYGWPHCFLYYYYMTVAKALAMCFVDKLPNGVNWHERLSTKLQTSQYKDGHWQNEWAPHGWEDIPELATAYAVLALQTKKPLSAKLWMSIILASNADLHVYDPHGRHIGMNYRTGEIENEIPGATFEIDSQGRQIVSLTELEAGTYRIELVGTETGNYSLIVNGYRDEEIISVQTYESSIREGQTLVGHVTVASTVGELTLYFDVPRPVPSGIKAIPGNGFVDLSWDPYQVAGFDLAGYNIYRSTTKGTGYEKINSEIITDTSYHDSGLVNGVTYYYVVTAVDTRGNETDYSREVSATPSADTTPPAAPVVTSPTHPDQNKWYLNNDPVFTWTEPEDPSGIAGYSYVLDREPSTLPDTTIDTTERTKSYEDLPVGTWYFHVRAVDGAGNWGPAGHYRINIGSPPSPPVGPVITLIAQITWPNDGAFVRAAIAITGTASGGTFDHYTIEYGTGRNPSNWVLIHSSTNSVTTGMLATWDTTTVSDGEYTIRLSVFDSHGNSHTAQVVVFIDNTPPAIHDLLPIEGDFATSMPTISATLTDNLSGIDEGTIVVKLNGLPVDPPPSFDPKTGKLSWTPQYPLGEGIYQVTIDVKDRAGNSAPQAKTTFVVSSKLVINKVLNYPNPCSSGTTFTYNLSQPAYVRIEIYTLAGELIKIIEPASGNVGYNQQYWDGRDERGRPLGNGVYIYRIVARAGNETVQAIGKLMVLR